MSHRIIIDSAVKSAILSTEVQDHLTTNQRDRTISICNGTTQPPCDDDMRYLLRCLDRAYSQDD
jgi:hypothetical protein